MFRKIATALTLFALALVPIVPASADEEFGPEDVLYVYCDDNFDPPNVVIVLLNYQYIPISYVLYRDYFEPLGFPPIVC